MKALFALELTLFVYIANYWMQTTHSFGVKCYLNTNAKQKNPSHFCVTSCSQVRYK